MGADLIGFTLVRPAKGAVTIAEKHVAKLKRVLADSKLNEGKKVAKLINLGVELEGGHDDAEMNDQEFLEVVQAEVDGVADFGVTYGYRDLASRFAKVGDQNIEIIFAGELSWGDEPQGDGYDTLKRFVTLGISQAWEKALIKKGAKRAKSLR